MIECKQNKGLKSEILSELYIKAKSPSPENINL